VIGTVWATPCNSGRLRGRCEECHVRPLRVVLAEEFIERRNTVQVGKESKGEGTRCSFLCLATVTIGWIPKSAHSIQRWLIFLRNHRDVIAAMDFFVVPTLTFRLIYRWFVIGHGRRRILHFDLTANPSAAWVIQQLREAFPFGTAPRHVIFDRDSIFSAHVVSMVKSLGIDPTRIGCRCPWQNGVAERWIGSVRRELLDDVVVLGERHLRRLLAEYVAYYHDDRTHLGLGKATPAARPVQPRPRAQARVVGLPRIGGLHHRYEWRAAA
jgi:putative transposase